ELSPGCEVPHVAGGILRLVGFRPQLRGDGLPAGHRVEAEAVLAHHGAGHDEKALLVFDVVDESPEFGGKNQPVLFVDRVGEFTDKHRDYLLSYSTASHRHPFCPTTADKKAAERVSRRT